jgi:hypothetical protein
MLRISAGNTLRLIHRRLVHMDEQKEEFRLQCPSKNCAPDDTNCLVVPPNGLFVPLPFCSPVTSTAPNSVSGRLPRRPVRRNAGHVTAQLVFVRPPSLPPFDLRRAAVTDLSGLRVAFDLLRSPRGSPVSPPVR